MSQFYGDEFANSSKAHLNELSNNINNDNQYNDALDENLIKTTIRNKGYVYDKEYDKKSIFNILNDLCAPNTFNISIFNSIANTFQSDNIKLIDFFNKYLNIYHSHITSIKELSHTNQSLNFNLDKCNQHLLNKDNNTSILLCSIIGVDNDMEYQQLKLKCEGKDLGINININTPEICKNNIDPDYQYKEIEVYLSLIDLNEIKVTSFVLNDAMNKEIIKDILYKTFNTKLSIKWDTINNETLLNDKNNYEDEIYQNKSDIILLGKTVMEMERPFQIKNAYHQNEQLALGIDYTNQIENVVLSVTGQNSIKWNKACTIICILLVPFVCLSYLKRPDFLSVNYIYNIYRQCFYLQLKAQFLN